MDPVNVPAKVRSFTRSWDNNDCSFGLRLRTPNLGEVEAVGGRGWYRLLSVTFRYRDHIGCNSSKIIPRPNSLRLCAGWPQHGRSAATGTSPPKKGWNRRGVRSTHTQNLQYPWNSATYDQGYYDGLRSRIRAFDCCQNQWPWMTLDGRNVTLAPGISYQPVNVRHVLRAAILLVETDSYSPRNSPNLARFYFLLVRLVIYRCAGVCDRTLGETWLSHTGRQVWRLHCLRCCETDRPTDSVIHVVGWSVRMLSAMSTMNVTDELFALARSSHVAITTCINDAHRNNVSRWFTLDDLLINLYSESFCLIWRTCSVDLGFCLFCLLHKPFQWNLFVIYCSLCAERIQENVARCKFCHNTSAWQIDGGTDRSNYYNHTALH